MKQIYGERAIKSLYKDTGAEFYNIRCVRACVAEVNDAGGDYMKQEKGVSEFGGRGQK